VVRFPSLLRRGQGVVVVNRKYRAAIQDMTSSVLNFALAVAILGGAWVLTHWFARAMYVVCPACHTLNARRRRHCRKCGQLLRASHSEVRKPD
jgi:ribosomal protein L40E